MIKYIFRDVYDPQDALERKFRNAVNENKHTVGNPGAECESYYPLCGRNNTDPDMEGVINSPSPYLKEDPVDPTVGMDGKTLTTPEYYPTPDPETPKPPRTELPNINDMLKK